jgi:hypothetical protein
MSQARKPFFRVGTYLEDAHSGEKFTTLRSAQPLSVDHGCCYSHILVLIQVQRGMRPSREEYLG